MYIELRIAAITVTKDDAHSFDSWRVYYEEYRNEISLHIIVDNGSSNEYKAQLKDGFPDSVIIERLVNGGTTAAYNDGIRLAMRDSEVDAIALIAQDIRFDDGAITHLYSLLFSNDEHGLVGPILLQANSNAIEAYGTNIKENLMIDRRLHGQLADDSIPQLQEVDLVPGGANIAKREVYEKVGLQDESLFMYGDETDYDIRVRRSGYRLLVTSKAKAWHQHINVSDKKYGSDVMFYYNNRNIILLNYRYSSALIAIRTFLYLFFWRGPRYLVGFALEREFRKSVIYYSGLIAGLCKIRKNWL